MVDKAIVEFDNYLGTCGLSFEATIIGGAVLLILGISDRQTRDVDCLYPKISSEVKLASERFAVQNEHLKVEKDWFNNGPSALVQELPEGWQSRLQPAYSGKNLILNTLGRDDFLKTKLFAYCDRTDPDYGDLLKLKPSDEELEQSIEWVKKCDSNSKWADHVEKMFLILKEGLNE